jgi:hypothetical protein
MPAQRRCLHLPDSQHNFHSLTRQRNHRERDPGRRALLPQHDLQQLHFRLPLTPDPLPYSLRFNPFKIKRSNNSPKPPGPLQNRHSQTIHLLPYQRTVQTTTSQHPRHENQHRHSTVTHKSAHRCHQDQRGHKAGIFPGCYPLW